MLLAQQLLFLRVTDLHLAGLAAIGGGFLAYTAATHEDLRLQEEFPFTRLTLHVVDGVAVLDVGIEAENHRD